MCSSEHQSHLLLTKEDTSQSELTEQPVESEHGQERPPLKQAKLQLGNNSISQTAVNRLIFEFVIDAVQSFSLVDQPSFRKLIQGISGGKTAMCRKTLVQHIEREFAVMKESLTATLQKVTNVCTTADLWNVHNRSFFGMTCHWIEEETMKRKSAALACARVKGWHTYDVLAAKISEIHAEYKVQHKVRATVTDNGSNFVTAFCEFETNDEPVPDNFDDGIRLRIWMQFLRRREMRSFIFSFPCIKDGQHTRSTW